jgi:hypothetical protein
MSSSKRVAQIGDIFILLVPTAQELQQLRKYQSELQLHIAGEIVDHIHITCQRFSLRDDQEIEDCLTPLKTVLNVHRPFPIYTDRIIQFEAPYHQHYVVRWRIKATKAWVNFRDSLDAVLNRIDCPSHFHRRRYASCTALNTRSRVDIDPGRLEYQFPHFLFNAQNIVISQLQRDNKFGTICNISL